MNISNLNLQREGEWETSSPADRDSRAGSEALQFGNDLQKFGNQFSERVFIREGDSTGYIPLGTAALF
uniref:SH3 domain-containing protein n=1 Tax=Bursaphelenchus xylophilus TaxID=6326 RepID=A0A1I7SLC4_BURXY